jgi:cytochrome c-type biogenesis protein CcmE
MDVNRLILYLIVGCITVIAFYVVLRLFAFSLFKSYFQAKSEFLTMLKKKKEDFRNGQ